jgi:hypothetical protein
MLKVDTRPSHAEVLADNLTMADYRGKYLEIYHQNPIFLQEKKKETEVVRIVIKQMALVLIY